MEFYSRADPHPAEQCLPTLSKLGNPSVSDQIDVQAISSNWLEAFARQISVHNVEGVLDLLVQSSFISDVLPSDKDGSKKAPSPSPAGNTFPVYWRDVLALTWDYRTFEGTSTIRQFLTSQLAKMQMSNVKLGSIAPALEKPFPDLTWIQAFFTFETEVGHGTGIVHLVPLASAQAHTTPKLLTLGEITWKANLVFTTLEGIKGHPEKIGNHRNPLPNHGRWEEERKKEIAFEDRDPTVLVIGGGHNGLNIGARLKALGLDTLILEKNERIGDNWRTRYEALCLHTTVWHDPLAYLPFPSTWPVYTPAKKLANWLESYAETLELNIWTCSTVLGATQHPETKLWFVKVRKPDGSERLFEVKYVIWAVGLKGGKAYTPKYPGMDKFEGQMLHSMEHKSALDHVGKRVVVIGSGTSAHDISAEYVENGIDVTMVQRGSKYVTSSKDGIPLLLGALYNENGHPTHVADMIGVASPIPVTAGILHRVVKIIAEKDRETLEGLEKVGFKLNMGFKDTGLYIWIYIRAAGFYVDVGASQYIIDEKIKLKSDSKIQAFTESSVRFEDGQELPADVVVFCTGLSNVKETLREIFGEDVANSAPQIWGLNKEGEKMGVFKEIGYKGLYVMMGDLSVSRFYSKHVAFQIKATEVGLLDESKRYTL
ncbi:hypothetical protein CPB83DRAFT_844342 [Crepidotus variabilis]|uniref:Flavin-containing monooxygenase n=1 Tax=Crepidotus variabilis TaxID=179855 RepID=A0A9P6ETF7_9AGAR|nr:hypothetical protein CPB83DRAFT_844342 [Crepidotus variabilis]